MNPDILTKENILLKINQQDAFNYYLQSYHNKGTLKKGKHISNPFLPEPQKSPSFNIFPSKIGNRWVYKDFATGDQGDLFDLVMKLNQCTFNEALTQINRDLHLNLYEKTTENKFSIDLQKQWDEHSLSYWLSYGISPDALNKFQVFPVISYTRIKEDGKAVTFTTTKENPIYAYEISNRCYKVYTPLASRYRFAWLGEKPEDYVFGFSQLPKTGDRVFITGGEKDVLSLATHNHNAICFNSETANPPVKIITELKNRFKEIVVLYDIDKTGIEQSEKLCKNYGLQRMELPVELLDDGKDISDFFKLGYTLDHHQIAMHRFEPEVENLEVFSPQKIVSPQQDYMPLLLKTQSELIRRKAERIIKAQPLLFQKDNGILFPRTINVIQGKAGVHKSRLAEMICSSLIKKPNFSKDLLSFRKNPLQDVTVCYVDTERNLTEQFPYALQQILMMAGYNKEDTLAHFDFISLLQIPRKDRFLALTTYIKNVKDKYSGHIVIILDVITDCIEDFNRSKDSMQLIDLMNENINTDNVTFLAVIHENPGQHTDKARGHLGTELMNKATTGIQIGFEKDGNRKPTNLIAMNVLKLRSGKKPEPFYMRYCEEMNGLIEADEDFIDQDRQLRRKKADIMEIIAELSQLLRDTIPSRELVELLARYFDCSDKIIRERLKECIDKRYPIANGKGVPCVLHKSKEGKEVFYSLSPIKRKTTL